MALEKEFTEILATMATNLGIAAERIFGVFVGAQPVIGIINIASTIVAFYVAYLFWKYTKKVLTDYCTDNDGEWEAEDARLTVIIVSIIVAVVALVISGMIMDMISDQVLRIVCPEYTAMKEIIGLVR